tara:strand:+ start:1585 stop:1941 length:357 start_codon:yes stop_codon:yes gene_type:complete
MIDIKTYNSDNIFAKILRKEVPSEKIYEDDLIYAFKDIRPQDKTHILVIPKSRVCSFNDFIDNSEPNTIITFMRSIRKIVDMLEISDGYRLITNVGNVGGQEVPHFHFHLISSTETKK